MVGGFKLIKNYELGITDCLPSRFFIWFPCYRHPEFFHSFSFVTPLPLLTALSLRDDKVEGITIRTRDDKWYIAESAPEAYTNSD